MSNALVNGLAGVGGGIIAQIITYPLQTLNTRQQTERLLAKKDRGGGTLFQFLQVVRTEGLWGLYSGLKPSLLGTAASQGVYYYFYQLFKNRAEAIASANYKKNGRGDGSAGAFSWLVVAALAGSLNVLLTNPIWVLVTRMQTHTQAQRKIVEAKLADDQVDDLVRPYGTLQAAREVYNESGITGFWKGVVPALIMVSNPSIQFMIYESLSKHLLRTANKISSVTSNTKKNLSALEIFVLVAIAKLGATISTYPLLVVKSRLQAKQEIGGGNASLRYSGTLDAIIKMIRHEGFRSFYQGMRTKIVQSVFAASLLFMVKEELVKLMHKLILANKSKVGGRWRLAS